MSAQHSVLELRTSRDATHTPETAVQLFATLPRVKNWLFDLILGKDEHLSFELVVLHQTIYFICYVPTRLVDYITSLLQSSYPEILVTPLEHDPVEHFSLQPDHNYSFVDQHTQFLELSVLKLKNASYFPLKTYQDFTDIDPLSTVLSTLSKSGPFDKVAIQIAVAHGGDGWKQAGHRLLQSQSGTQLIPENNSAQPLSGHRALIERKLSSQSLQCQIKLAVNSHSRERSLLITETLATAFQSITQSEGNSLQLARIHWRHQHFLHQLKHRQISPWQHQYLSLSELATIFHLPNEKLAHIPNIAWGKRLRGEPPENLPIVSRTSDPEYKRNVNAYAKTEFKNTESIFGLLRPDRRRHVYVIGKTGTGKSTLLANMAINDLKNNEGLAVIDPHGDLVETLLNYIPSHRINDVVYFNPSDPEKTVKLNLFEGENVEHRELIASGIVSIFQKLYSYSWGPRLEYILRNALLTLLTAKTSRMSDILDLLTDKKFRDEVIANLDDQVLKNFWLNEFDQMPDRQRTEAIAPILNKVGQFVSSPLIRNIVNATKSSFSIEELMRDGKILLVNLSQGKLGEDNATLLGAMLITKIQLAAMSRVHQSEDERRDFFLYVDEFQNFATGSFIKILSEARKYRLNLTLANQYIAQIPLEVQKAIFGNCGTLISFVMGADDAQAFSKEFGSLYSDDDLVSLGRHQIINKITIDNIISRPFPATTLPLAKSSNSNRDKVIQVSRERYAKKK